VLRIDPSASTSATDQLVTFRIVVSMDGIPSTVRPGMTASISITTDEAAGVLAVPQAAITTVGGVSTVQVLQPDNTTVETTVQLGLKGDALTEITDGVAKGDVLAIPTGTSGVSEFPRGGPPGAPQSRSRN
jgi:macrolide-specific efflux system membrane fusion protein